MSNKKVKDNVTLDQLDLFDNDAMSLQERIRKLFADHPDKKPAHLARALGVSRAAVSRWMSGAVAEISSENAFAVGKFFGVNPEWVATGKGKILVKTDIQVSSNAVWQGGFSLWDNATPLGEDEVAVPFFREVELSAGSGRHEVLENHGLNLRFAKSTLRKQGVPPGAARCVTISGNSMEPVLPDGATVGVDTSKTKIEDGKMFAIDHDGYLRVKVLYKMPGGGIRLRSFNFDEWPDESYLADQATNIRILGKVFWYSVLT